MEYNFTYLKTEIIDDESKVIYFTCNGFMYHVRCLNDIVQYIKGEYPEEYLNRPTPPTEDEIIEHDYRRKLFNTDHNIIQTWIDSLK